MRSAQVLGVVALACGIALSVLMTSPARAVPLKDTSTSGSWNTGANWTPSGVPVAGESVNVDLNMTVATSASFGDSATQSVWTGVTSNDSIVVNSGVTLTHVAGSTLVIPNTVSDIRLGGLGTFLNNGLMQFTGNNVFYIGVSGLSKLDNAGTFEFNGTTNQRIDLYGNGSRFNNVAGGTVLVNMPTAASVARIMGTQSTSDGQFVQTGNPITFNQGVLVLAPPNGIGGTLDDSMLASLIGVGPNPINANSQLQLAGGMNNIVLTGGTNLDRVKLGAGSDVFYVRSGGTTINVSGTGIKTANSGLVQFEAGAGRTLTNQGRIILDVTSGDVRLNGLGSYDNASTGIIEHRAATVYMSVGGSTIINNSGQYEFNTPGVRLDMYQGSPRFNNLAGGVINVNMPTAAGVARIMSSLNSSGTDGQFIQTGNNGINFTQGVLVLAPPNGFGSTINDTMLTQLIGAGPNPINVNSELRLAGGLNDIVLTGGTHLNRVKLGAPSDAIWVRAGGSSINVSGTGISTANGGSVAIETNAAGRILTNLGTLVLDTPSGDVRINGNGSLNNNGTVTQTGTLMYINVNAGQTAAFNNSGTHTFTTNGAVIDLYQGGGSYNNLAGGTLRASMPTSGSLANFRHSASGTPTFTNLGTVETTGGILRVNSNISMPQLSSTALTGGTWKVLANTVDATLDLQASSTGIGGAALYDGTINTISSGAALVMSKQGAGSALFPQLGALQTVGGSLYVHGMTLPVAAAMNVTGTLGGDGFITTPGTITLNGGVLDPSTLTGGPGSLSINGNLSLGNTTQLNYSLDTPGIVGSGVNDLVAVSGNLTLDGVLNIIKGANFGSGSYRLFNYTGTLTDLGLTVSEPNYSIDTSIIGQVNLNVLPVPEPSTGLLLLAGLVALRRRKRS
jgi:fibronectin-binding autotransporter adhesin